MCFSNLFAPWQESFVDARDGDGGGDHLGPFTCNLRTILGPTVPTYYVFQLKTNFLEMAHLNLFSYIRMTAYQPLIRTQNNKSQHFEN